MSENHAQRLARLDSCAVSDALDQLGLPPSVSGLSALAAGKRLSGTIVTVRLAAGKAAEGAPLRHLCAGAIDMAEPGQVIVVEQRTGIECAGWGGILSNAGRLRGVAGVIVEGYARDIDEANEIGFTVYGRGATARTARGRIHEVETGGTIRIGDVEAISGDWVVADGSGAAFVPADRIGDVLRAAERIAAKEAAMTKDVLSGRGVSQVMGADYEHLLERTAGDDR